MPLNEPYTCHEEGCSEEFDLWPEGSADDATRALEIVRGERPAKVRVKCPGCYEIYKIDMITKTPLE